MKIKDWPSGERPREKLLAEGARTLSDAELLAILLRHGTPRNDAVSLARGLLSSSGSLRELLEADLLTFCSLPGCGPAGFATRTHRRRAPRLVARHAGSLRGGSEHRRSLLEKGLHRFPVVRGFEGQGLHGEGGIEQAVHAVDDLGIREPLVELDRETE